MSPGEIAGVVGVILAVGQLVEKLATRLSAPPPRETQLPREPSPSGLHQVAAGECGGCSVLARRVDSLEGRERSALVEVTKITEQIRGLRGKGNGNDGRGSTG